MHSIVIPHFNQPESLVSTILQLQQQVQVPDEIVVVDDGSTVPLPDLPDSVCVIRHPRSPKLYSSHSTCINLGIAQAKGEQITLMCVNWTFPPTFCATAQAKIRPGIIWCATNAKQGSRQATSVQDADNGCNFSLHRDDWVDWDEGFDRVGGHHHILWWIHTRMQKGVQFWYDPTLADRHRHSPFAGGIKIAINPSVSWNYYQGLLQGAPQSILDTFQPGEDPEIWYTRNDPVCACENCAI